MSQKVTYEVQLGSPKAEYRDWTLDECADVEAQCKAIREKAEAEKPKLGDFAVCDNGVLCIRLGNRWESLGPETRLLPVGRTTAFPTLPLGNLEDIVENQGPIVIGMTAKEAAGYNSGARPPGIFDHVRDALARYRKGQP